VLDSDSQVSPWGRVDPEELASRFKAHKLMELGEALDLIDQSREVLRKEPNILQLQVRAVLCCAVVVMRGAGGGGGACGYPLVAWRHGGRVQHLDAVIVHMASREP
jgi:hypothetical protein